MENNSILSKKERKDLINYLMNQCVTNPDGWCDFNKVSESWERLRDDFVNNSFWRGMDLNFDTYMIMSGFTRNQFEIINHMSILIKSKS